MRTKSVTDSRYSFVITVARSRVAVRQDGAIELQVSPDGKLELAQPRQDQGSR